jgi:hypothetical protein
LYKKKRILKYPYLTSLNFVCYSWYFGFFIVYENIERTKIPPNKSVITNKPRKNIKIILIQKHSFFNGKNKMITTLHWWIESYKGNYNKFPMLFSIFIICYCPTIYMLVTRSKEIIILTKLNGHTTQMDRNSFYPFGFR